MSLMAQGLGLNGLGPISHTLQTAFTVNLSNC